MFRHLPLVLLVLGCSDTVSEDASPWQLGEDAGADARSLDTTPAAPDSDPGDDANGSPAECRPRVVVEEGVVQSELTRPIVVHGGSWFFLRADERGRHGLWRREDLEEPSVLLRDDVTSLVDAGPRGILFIEDGRHVLLNPNSGEESVLGPADGFREWERAPNRSAAFRFVGDDVVTWTHSGMWVATFSGTAQLSGPVSSLPYARNGYVAFSSATNATAGGLTVFRDARRYEFSEVNALNTALSNTHMWFVRNGSRLFNVSLDALASARVDSVSPEPGADCRGVNVSENGREVAASCLLDGAPRIYTRRDEGDWVVAAKPVADPKHVFAIDAGWVVYAHWNSTPPMLVAVPPGQPDRAFEVAEMTTGCPACGAYWPPNYVELEGGKLVWNYASIDEPALVNTRVGMAEICP